MMPAILLALNSYKECADSVTAVDLFSNYLSSKSEFELIKKPISDGGDGFLLVCKELFHLLTITFSKINIYNDYLTDIHAGYDRINKTLFIESANIIGLKNILKKYRNPLHLNSRGLGEVLRRIFKDHEEKKFNIQKVIIGVGGTATNDLALGLCSAFGLKLFDKGKNELQIIPINYSKAISIEWEKVKLPFEIEAIVDVDNLLMGDKGAAKTFAKQKGAAEEDILLLEEGTKNIVNLLNEKGMIKNAEKLFGAGGGLAAGLEIFFDAKIKMAEEFIKGDLGLNKLVNKMDYVITGEGSFDHQSFMNKGTGIILNTFKNNAKKIFLCCGIIEDNVKSKLSGNVYTIELSKYFNSKEESISNFEKGIELACKEILSILES